MSFLGGLAGLLLCLAVLAVPGALCFLLGLWAYTSWQRAQRARRWAQEQPYDYGKRKAFEAYARERGERDALRELEGLDSL
jgi:cytochrome c oxidase assembly factor CtaG